MKPSIRKGLCPECEVQQQLWIVRGADNTCWTCTNDWNQALRYAIERIEQPGTGDQVQNSENRK